MRKTIIKKTILIHKAKQSNHATRAPREGEITPSGKSQLAHVQFKLMQELIGKGHCRRLTRSKA